MGQPLLEPENVIRMTIPNGPPVPMDQVTVGLRYSSMDFARDCGCEYCQAFVDAYEKRMQSFSDTIVDVLKVAATGK